jgi:hypothetical protein
MTLLCMRGHAEPVADCFSCRKLATEPAYRAAVAKLRGQAVGEAVTEPGFFQKAATFAKAAARHLTNGLPTVTDEVKAQRLALCVVCEHYNAARGTCNKCGCILKTKTSWALEKCPIGKW